MMMYMYLDVKYYLTILEIILLNLIIVKPVLTKIQKIMIII